MINKLAKLLFVIIIITNHCSSSLYAMSEDRSLGFMPLRQPTRMPLPSPFWGGRPNQAPQREANSVNPHQRQVYAPTIEGIPAMLLEDGTTLPAQTFRTNGFRNDPTQNALYVRQFTEQYLTGRQNLNQVTELDLTGQVGDQPLTPDGAAHIISLIERFYPNITSLTLRYINSANEIFNALARSNIAPRLTTLILDLSRLTPVAFTTDNLNRFTSLQDLSVNNSPLNQADFEAALMASNLCQTLRRLSGTAFCSRTLELLRHRCALSCGETLFGTTE